MKYLEMSYPFIICCCIFYAIDRNGSALNTIAAALIHECGHFLMILALKRKIKGIRFRGIGVSIVYNSFGLTEKAEAAVYAAGPAFGAAAAITAELIGEHGFAAASEGLTLINLLPAIPLDGGYILKSLLTFDNAYTITSTLSFITALSVSSVGVILGYQNGNFTLFAVGVTLFICHIRGNVIE